MIVVDTANAFEAMTAKGAGDAGLVAIGLRRDMTGLGLRALASKAVHVAAAAPERLSDVYDNAAAGWLGGAVFPARLRTSEPLPISRQFWSNFWEVLSLPPETPSVEFARRMLRLAGNLDPRVNERIAAAALTHPGVSAAAARGIRDPYDPRELADHAPSSLAYAIAQETGSGSDAALVFQNIGPFLRRMPPPLGYINAEVMQSLVAVRVVAGYSSAWLDQMALGAFLMGQASHHYSALTTAVVLTAISLNRPAGLELVLESIFRGWQHGRTTPLLMGVPWEELWDLRVDQVREALQVVPFASPFVAAVRSWPTS